MTRVSLTLDIDQVKLQVQRAVMIAPADRADSRSANDRTVHTTV
jgi:hypothetical protein